MKKNIEIETLTPVHVGSGEILKANTEYLYFSNENTIAIIDEKKIYDIIGKDGVDRWINIVEKNEDLLGYLRQRKPDVTARDVAKNILPVMGKKSKKDLRAQQKNAFGNPIIPGSSLKGAIRTAFFRYFVYHDKPDHVKGELDRQAQKIKENPKRNTFRDGDLQKRYFGPNPNYDLMRLLRVGDFTFDTTGALLAQTLNERKGAHFEMKDQGENYIEAIAGNEKATGTIQLADELKQMIGKFARKNHDNKLRKLDEQSNEISSFQKLFNTINQHTGKLIENEIALYEDVYHNFPEEAAGFFDELKKLKAAADVCEENACIIRLGFGAGHHFMTGDWIHKFTEDNDPLYQAIAQKARRDFNGRYNDFDLPKTRKMVLDGVPLGFIKLTIKS